MRTFDSFERRLAEALLEYAADAAIEPDPMAFAARIAAEQPRRGVGVRSGGLGVITLRPIWIVLALLLVAAAIGAAAVGFRPPVPVELPMSVVPVPDGMFGRFQSSSDPARYLTLRAPTLVHDADGRAIDSMGAVVGFLPSGPAAAEGRIFIHAPGACGDATYQLIPDEPSTDGPTAAPMPSPLVEPPRPLSAFRLADSVDSCSARQALLGAGRWTRVALTLTAGGSYGSLDFGEPFHLLLPPAAADGLFSAEIGTMYQLLPNQLRISHPWWNGEFVDDVPVNRIPCSPELGTLPDIPTSVDAVETWLTAGPGLRLAPPTELMIDGRRALRWRTVETCGVAISELATGDDYYAIPTGDDVILFVVRPDTANEAKVAERIVLAISFD